MVLPKFQPFTCPDGRQIPQSSQTDGLFPSDIQKLCNEIVSTAIQATTSATTKEEAPTNSTTFTILLAAGISIFVCLFVVCILLAIKNRQSLTYANACDCLTWMVGGLFCCLCEKRLKRIEHSKGAKNETII